MQQVIPGNAGAQAATDQFTRQAAEATGAQLNAAAGKALGGTPDDPPGQLGAQLGSQLTQSLLNQADGQNGGKAPAAQLKDHAVQALSSQAGARIGQALAAPGADPSTQLRSQAGAQLTQTLIDQASGSGNVQSLTGQLKGQATEVLSSQAGTRVGQTLGALTGKLNEAMGGPQATATPDMRDGLQSAAATTLADPVAQKISQSMSASRQPLLADMLQLSLQRTGAQITGAANLGSFAPPTGSALPISADALHSGINILSSSSGKAGLGVWSALSKTVELSGTLDPESADGAAAGIQIKIGGN